MDATGEVQQSLRYTTSMHVSIGAAHPVRGIANMLIMLDSWRLNSNVLHTKHIIRVKNSYNYGKSIFLCSMRIKIFTYWNLLGISFLQ